MDVRGKTLSQINLSSRQHRKVYRSNNPTLQIQYANESIFLATTKRVIRFSLEGAVTQVIPIVSEKSLLSMEISATKHSYIFSDGGVEVKDLDNQSSTYFTIPTKKISSLRKHQLRNGHIASITNKGVMSLIQLATAPTTSFKNAANPTEKLKFKK